MVIQIDMDGCLADFVAGFTEIANRLYGTSIITTPEQKSWDFEGFLDEGQVSSVWKIIRNTPGWWRTLEPLVGSETFRRIRDLDFSHSVYFVTHRMSDVGNPQKDTAGWLRDNGILRPHVVVTPRKGDVARAVEADFSIEDKFGNAVDISSKSCKTESYLINRPYNRDGCSGCFDERFRVDSVGEFLDKVEGAAHGQRLRDQG